MSNILIVGANQGIGYYMVVRLLEKGNKTDENMLSSSPLYGKNNVENDTENK